MRRRIVLGLVALGCVSAAFFFKPRPGQPPEVPREELPTSDLPRLGEEEAKKSLLAHAKRSLDAGVNKDHAALVDLMHPALVHNLGGRAKAIAATKKSFDELTADGATIISAECGEPSEFTEANGRLYVVVPTPSMMEIDGKQLIYMAHLLGVSADGGRNWRFAACGGRNMGREVIKKLIPDLPDGVKLPEPSLPILIDEGKR